MLSVEHNSIRRCLVLGHYSQTIFTSAALLLLQQHCDLLAKVALAISLAEDALDHLVSLCDPASYSEHDLKTVVLWYWTVLWSFSLPGQMARSVKDLLGFFQKLIEMENHPIVSREILASASMWSEGAVLFEYLRVLDRLPYYEGGFFGKRERLGVRERGGELAALSSTSRAPDCSPSYHSSNQIPCSSLPHEHQFIKSPRSYLRFSEQTSTSTCCSLSSSR